jgi:hypothetical protein
VIVYRPRYRHGHEADFVPPITGIHQAALTPSDYQVHLIHQQVQPIHFDTDADLIALSFSMTRRRVGSADDTSAQPAARRIADSAI